MAIDIRLLIKECIIQTLKEDLTKEGFDPTSVGPNPEASEGLSVYNPYETWNAKMRTMEDMELPIDNKDYLPPVHPEDKTTPSTLPLGGEKKYYKQLPGGEMGAVNSTSLANESQGCTSVPHDYKGENNRMRVMDGTTPENKMLDDLGKKINHLIQKRLSVEKELLSDAIEMGECFIEVKNILKHGEFSEWLARNANGISMKTATNFMRVAVAKNRIHGVKNIRQAYISVGIIKPSTINENEHGRYAQEAGAGQFDPRKFGLKTFKEIKNEQDPDGKKHDLKLVCKKCGTSATCRCRKPKRMFEGICDDCAAKKL